MLSFLEDRHSLPIHSSLVVSSPSSGLNPSSGLKLSCKRRISLEEDVFPIILPLQRLQPLRRPLPVKQFRVTLFRGREVHIRTIECQPALLDRGGHVV